MEGRLQSTPTLITAVLCMYIQTYVFSFVGLMSVRVRFAPAPTGNLHLGNARIAVLNSLFALHTGGEMWLRMDDTDVSQCRLEYETSIVRDLTWLGVCWSQLCHQSQRSSIYEHAFERLKATGAVYPCYETPEELETMRQAQRAQGLPPRYRRSPHCLPSGVTDRPAHWRFALGDLRVQWTDVIQGDMTIDMCHQSDPVIRRHDGSMSYLLASAVDDMEMGMTHIIRGADHLTNSAIQTLMIRALGGQDLVWAHVPLMVNDQGEKFSKRKGSLSIAELREEGWMPLSIVQSLVQLGLSHDVAGDWNALAAQFSLQDYRSSVAQYSLTQLGLAQERVWAETEEHQLPEQLSGMLTPEQWRVLRHNLHHPKEMHQWHQILSDSGYDPSSHLSGPELPKEFWSRALNRWEELLHTEITPTWGLWKEALQLDQWSAKQIAQGLRWAITGLPKGPKMEDIVAMMNPDMVRHRLAQRV